MYSRIEHNKKIFTFSAPNSTLKIHNGLDYIPLLTWIQDLPPTARTRGRQSNAAILRRSNRTRFPSQKIRDIEADSPTPVLASISSVNSQPNTTFAVKSNVNNAILESTFFGDDKKDHSSSQANHPAHSMQTPQKNTTSVPILKPNQDDQPTTIATQTSLPQMFHLTSLLTHFKFGCKNYQSLSHMSKSGSLTNMPPVKCPSRDCPACLLVKGSKLRRNLVTKLTNLRP